MTLLRASKWEFETSNGGSANAGIFGVEGGSVTLVEPGTKRKVKFAYAAMGAGIAIYIGYLRATRS
jgi:hypothetical protein